jgi:hypothetical protein
MAIADYAGVKVAEIRKELVETYGLEESEVKSIKGKLELVKMIEEQKTLAAIDDIDFGDESNNGDFEAASDEVVSELLEQAEEEQEVSTPSICDPEWSDYVLSKFEYDELVDGSPTVDGLRRVTELVLGPIIEMKSNIVQTPDKENQGRATVSCSITVVINWSDNLHHRTATGSGDAWHKNTDMPYSKFPVAMAETRAEGRALRRLLQLRKVVAAEELSEVSSSEEPDYSENINDSQISFIDVMCKSVGRGLDISVEKLIRSQYPVVSTIRDVKHSQASEVIQRLSHYQQKMEEIPEAIKGYDSNWRKVFDAN